MAIPPRIFKKSELWLLVFVGGHRDEEKRIANYIKMICAQKHLSEPKYKTIRLDVASTHKFPTTHTAPNELTELFNDTVLTKLVEEKTKVSANQVALIISRNAFPNEDVFRRVIKDTVYGEDLYHTICTCGDFSDFDKRLACYERLCSTCDDFANVSIVACLVYSG